MISVCVCRALCFLKLERFADAKKDCDAALKLEPNNKKAFYRRALAHKGLKVRRVRARTGHKHLISGGKDTGERRGP